jgi:hypothetical protein
LDINRLSNITNPINISSSEETYYSQRHHSLHPVKFPVGRKTGTINRLDFRFQVPDTHHVHLLFRKVEDGKNVSPVFS